ncbi:hypothetical protein HPP92_001028 [Vanilla planifolia]|uniref:Uncharacterized protein n=1 Tax=Vanilla planifolia TaxID=51239 RepID=A0A835S6W9_VANPL|nr:hypothetical protein HPP92_001028 [Vanilla planifolia]
MVSSLPIILLVLFLDVLSPSSGSPSAYDMLEEFGFPRGILPQGVKGYRLDPDGSFEVLLSGDCEFRVDGGGYLLKYRRKITGKVKSGQLKGLNGIRVKVLLFWFGIDEVLKSGTDLQFSVGPLSATFPSSNFGECPKCRCGSRCGAITTAFGATELVSDS